MAVKKVNLIGNVEFGGAKSPEGLSVTAVLSAAATDVETGEDILPEVITTITDADGYWSLPVWPNGRDVGGKALSGKRATYTIKISDGNKSLLDRGGIIVPDAEEGTNISFYQARLTTAVLDAPKQAIVAALPADTTGWPEGSIVFVRSAD